MAYDLGDFLEDMLDFDNELIKPDSVVIEGGDKIETFTIKLPDDLFDDKDVEGDYAIDQARETCATYIVPCVWSAVETSPHVWAVKRTSNAK